VALDRLREFGARVVIPGHCSERILELLDGAAEDRSRLYDSCIDWTREYLGFYEDVYETADTGPRSSSRVSGLGTRT
jgi:hypothetical protein